MIWSKNGLLPVNSSEIKVCIGSFEIDFIKSNVTEWTCKLTGLLCCNGMYHFIGEQNLWNL